MPVRGVTAIAILGLSKGNTKQSDEQTSRTERKQLGHKGSSNSNSPRPVTDCGNQGVPDFAMLAATRFACSFTTASILASNGLNPEKSIELAFG